MSNYDMSEAAYRERVELARRLEKIDVAIIVLADTCEDLIERQSKMLNAMEQLQDMVNINHEMIQEINKCLKQE